MEKRIEAFVNIHADYFLGITDELPGYIDFQK